MQMRLDLFLSENKLVDSRTDAKKFICDGSVKVNHKVITKPSFEILGDEKIEVDKSQKKFASRGGLKLEAALDRFSVKTEDVIAIDIGASSGGFTDCLLQRGARHVIAVDSGYGQIVERLRYDERVTVIENYNARYMNESDFELVPTLAVMDVSFISAKMIFQAVHLVLADGGDYICLIKPQFEVGRSGLNKKGIVKNDTLRKNAVDEVISFAKCVGFKFVGIIESPITGGDGNIEYLAHFKKEITQ